MPSPPSAPPDRRSLIGVGVFLAALVIMIVLQYVSGATASETLPYSEARSLLRGKQVSEVTLSGDPITGKYKTPRNG